ncbi:hypothetical protein ABEL50_20805 [Escherichia coli]
MNALEKLLIEEISLAEQERAEFEEKIKGLNQKILDYRTALNHARDSDFSLSKKSRNVRFQSSPRQLVAHILKSNLKNGFIRMKLPFRH